MSDARLLLAAADALLGAGFVVSAYSVLRGRWRRPGTVLLWAGFSVLSAGLYLRGVDRAALPVGNVFEILHALAWGVVAADIFLRLASRVRLPDVLVAGLSALLGGAAFLRAGFDGPTTGSLGGNPWVGFHVGAIVLAFSLFAALALNSLAYLLQHSALSGHRPGVLSRVLPPLRQLDRVGVQMLGVGVGLLTLALAVGFAGLGGGTAGAGASSAKLLSAAAVWLGYLTLFALRRTERIGARGYARAAVALFALSLFSFWPANAARTPTLLPVSTAPAEVRP
jgi:HemX protein